MGHSKKKLQPENSFYITKHFMYLCTIKNQMNGQTF